MTKYKLLECFSSIFLIRLEKGAQFLNTSCVAGAPTILISPVT